MSTIVDSEAEFFARFKELGLGGFEDNFRKEGWTTFGRFAFSCDYVPGQDSSNFDKVVSLKGLGAEDHKDKLVARRLFYEAYTMTAGDLKRRLDRNEEDAPRKIPSGEREARRKRLQARLNGTKIQGW